MLGAYYSKAVESKEIFDKLNISQTSDYGEHLNKYNVIYITFNILSDRGNTYEDYIERIRTNLKNDILEKYPNVDLERYFSISDLLESVNEKIIFIFDEWDYIFNNNLFVENQNDFLEFLRNLLKDQPYVTLCYMTGVLPILQYNDENSLSCVLTLAYLTARDIYRIEREEKTGKGYADFTFHPRRKKDIAFIVELKKDELPEVAIKQIKEKEYVEKFKKENEGKKVLAVAICYDSKKKEHQCKIEEILN